MVRRRIILGPCLLTAGLLAMALVGSTSGFAIDGNTFDRGTEHTITWSGTTLAFHQMPFYISNATGASTGNIIYTNGTTRADWRDLRFANATGGTIYPYWIEWTNATTAYVWANVTSIPNGDSVVRCYYDSDTAPGASDGAATFPFFDTFDGETLGPQWTAATTGAGTVTVSGSTVVLHAGVGGAGSATIYGSGQFEPGYALRTRAKTDVAAGTSTTRVAEIMFAKQSNEYGAHIAPMHGSPYNKKFRALTSTVTYQNIATWDADTFYTVEARREASPTTGFQIVGQSAVNISASYYAGSDCVAYFKNTASSTADVVTTVDWVLIRKHVPSEPGHGTYTALAEPPSAAFSGAPDSGSLPLSVTFTDTSTGAPTSWEWDFDNDGDTDSTDQNPTYEYAAEGIYTVKLTVSNTAGSDTETKADYITVTQPYDPPIAAFSANVTEGYAPLTVAFTDTSTGPPTEWAWEFTGPNEFYDLDLNRNPTLTFTEPGTYSVSLRVANPAGNDYENKTDYITVLEIPTGPVASFAADIVSGHAPLAVQFTDTSTGSPTAWAWDFDGDAVADSTEQNPTYEYAANGTYTVTLQVSNAGGTDLETKTGYVYVGELTARLLRASFSYSTPIGTAPFSVSFADTSASNGTYARVWDFGDGATSTEPAPVHEYATAGKYDVELVITSDYTQDTSAARKAVMAYPAAAVSPLPTTTFGAHMTEIMESNWNVSVIGPIIPRAYTDALTPLAGDTGVGNMIFWGIIWVGVFMILFLRQGTPWLAALVGLVAGPGILTFLPPEWAHVGYICLAVTIGCSFFVIALGRFRST